MTETVVKKDITLDLINPQTLQISCKCKLEKKVEKEIKTKITIE